MKTNLKTNMKKDLALMQIIVDDLVVVCDDLRACERTIDDTLLEIRACINIDSNDVQLARLKVEYYETMQVFLKLMQTLVATVEEVNKEGI